MPDPALMGAILEVDHDGAVLAVRPSCDDYHCWQVYFGTNRVLADLAAELASAPSPA